MLPWHHRYGWCGRASESVLGLGGGGRANVYSICELSDFGLNKHQLGLAQVLALEQCLQVQERLQFCLNSSIMRVLRKFSPCHPDQLLDILLNLIYAYSGQGAKGILGRGLLLVRCGNWRSGLGCRSAGVCIGSLGGLLAGCKTDTRSRTKQGTHIVIMHGERLRSDAGVNLLHAIGSWCCGWVAIRCWSGVRRSRSLTIRRIGPASRQQLLLPLEAILVGRERGGSSSDQGVLNGTDDLVREHRNLGH